MFPSDSPLPSPKLPQSKDFICMTIESPFECAVIHTQLPLTEQIISVI